jgi:hypothetical protein
LVIIAPGQTWEAVIEFKGLVQIVGECRPGEDLLFYRLEGLFATVSAKIARLRTSSGSAELMHRH